MALTVEEEQRLEKEKLIAFFDKSKARWMKFARNSYKFLHMNFPADATVHPDDVAKVLMPILEVDDSLIKAIEGRRLTQKYWYRYFCDLILDRLWDDISV